MDASSQQPEAGSWKPKNNWVPSSRTPEAKKNNWIPSSQMLEAQIPINNLKT